MTDEDATASAALFEPVDAITVAAPSQFPKPTRAFQFVKNNYNSTSSNHHQYDPSQVDVIATPTFGRHRPDQDAVLAYAEGYTLPYYVMFMETLAATGYTGDVVLAVAEARIVKDHVVEYLKRFTYPSNQENGNKDKPNLVVYQYPLECEGDPAGDGRRTVTKQGATDSTSRKGCALLGCALLLCLLTCSSCLHSSNSIHSFFLLACSVSNVPTVPCVWLERSSNRRNRANCQGSKTWSHCCHLAL